MSGAVYQMPQGDWAAACDNCGLITDGFEYEAQAARWLAACPLHHGGRHLASRDQEDR